MRKILKICEWYAFREDTSCAAGCLHQYLQWPYVQKLLPVHEERSPEWVGWKPGYSLIFSSAYWVQKYGSSVAEKCTLCSKLKNPSVSPGWRCLQRFCESSAILQILKRLELQHGPCPRSRGDQLSVKRSASGL